MKSTPHTASPEWDRPADISVEVIFGSDNRRVTPKDLEFAGQAAATAVRAVLESRPTPYSVEQVNVKVKYSYVQSVVEFTA